jgi:hypothetical protein
MLDTLEVTKDLLDISMVLTSSPGQIPGERAKGTHDLGDRVDADVEQFTTSLAYAATTSVSGTSGNGIIREARSAPTAIGRTQQSQFGMSHCSRSLPVRPLDRH